MESSLMESTDTPVSCAAASITVSHLLVQQTQITEGAAINQRQRQALWLRPARQPSVGGHKAL